MVATIMGRDRSRVLAITAGAFEFLFFLFCDRYRSVKVGKTTTRERLQGAESD